MRSVLLLLFFPLIGLSQQLEYVDFLQIDARLDFNNELQKVEGSYNVKFQVLKSIDSIYLDAKSMHITNVEERKLRVVADENKIWIYGPFDQGKSYSTNFRYEAFPAQTLYFTEDQIWTQGQGKYTSHWLPSIDDMNDKIEFDLTVVARGDVHVIANGTLSKTTLIEDKVVWHFDMERPMSSYLAAVVVGDFAMKRDSSNSGIPLELYYKPEDSLKAEPTYRYTNEIFDFLEEEIGIDYPWQNYKQVPVRDFLYAGMENTTLTIFSEAFVVDSIGYNDRNYVNVNAHELAHQWFGNLVTETEGTHHWLHEGFATFYALLAEKELFGDDYYYWKLYNTAEQLKVLSDDGKGQSLLDPKASSLTFYEKGAWALHVLRELVGPEAFRTAVKNYLDKYRFQNVTTQNFLDEVDAVTEEDLQTWEMDWLKQSAFKAEQAFQSLSKSNFINRYFEIQRLRSLPIEQKREEILARPELFSNDYLGQELVGQLDEEPIEETRVVYLMALEAGNLYVRQEVALSLINIPADLRVIYETLLEDPSYITQEAAFYNLWTAFPSHRTRYLDKMKGIEGFQDKNIRQLWLALAITTPNYMVSAKDILKQELLSYTAPNFSFEIRQKALEYAYLLGILEKGSLLNLVNGCVHHNWRFRNFCRSLLDEIMLNPAYKMHIESLESNSEKEQAFLKSIISG